MIKKKYNIGDTVWIYGVSKGKSDEGKIIHQFAIDDTGAVSDLTQGQIFYVISIPTNIEPLLEVRTWDTISQTKNGHVGGVRQAIKDADASLKAVRRNGIDLVSDDADSITEDDIPLIVKPTKRRRRFTSRKKTN